VVALRTVGSKENPAPGTGLDCRLRGNDGERKTRESPFRQAEPVEAWFLTADCRLRGNDGRGTAFTLAPFSI